jgi:hypothetical protein
MTEFTPGPWHATANLNDGPHGPSYTIRKNSQVTIASVSGASLHRGSKQSAANAQLLAAAPELLAALEAYANPEHWQEMTGEFLVHELDSDDRIVWDAGAIAHTAIIKARGE